MDLTIDIPSEAYRAYVREVRRLRTLYPPSDWLTDQLFRLQEKVEADIIRERAAQIKGD